MKRKPILILALVAGLVLALGLLAATRAWAGPSGHELRTSAASSQVVTGTLSYQGQLLDSQGAPVNGAPILTFRLYGAPGDQVALWSQTEEVQVNAGLFTTYLQVDLSLFDGRALWLGIQVAGDSAELGPRQPVLPAPFALSLRPGAVISASLDLSESDGVLHLVNSDASNGGGYALSALNYSGNTWRPAIYGENKGASAGIYGRSDGWHAVVGWNNSDEFAGVYGRNSSTGQGVFGENVGSGYGVHGESLGGVGVSGLGHAAGVVGNSEQGLGVSGHSFFGTGGIFASENGHSLVTMGPSLLQGPNPQQIALLRWYPAAHAPINFTVGSDPRYVAFDGANIWVSNYASGYVSVLRANNGQLVFTTNVNWPEGLAFDGAFMWVTDRDGGVVNRVRASDGSLLPPVSVGSLPTRLAFDGLHMWVANSGSHDVSVVDVNSGAIVITLPVPYPRSLAFDGVNMWVVSNSGYVKVFNAATFDSVMTPTVGSYPAAIAFDGAKMWVTNVGDDSLSVLRAADGALLTTLGAPTIGDNPLAIAFDGANMWVVNQDSHNVSVIRAADTDLVTSFINGNHPSGIAFDGANMWVTNATDGTVSKR